MCTESIDGSAASARVFEVKRPDERQFCCTNDMRLPTDRVLSRKKPTEYKCAPLFVFRFYEVYSPQLRSDIKRRSPDVVPFDTSSFDDKVLLRVIYWQTIMLDATITRHAVFVRFKLSRRRGSAITVTVTGSVSRNASITG